jgi:transcriptional regulator of acetoin/glycerol metabolism
VSDRTVTEHAQRSSPAAERNAVLGLGIVHSRGPRPLAPFAVGARTTLGREGDIALDDLGVSRVHAELCRRGDGVWVRDLGSRNGTFLNGHPVGPDGALARPGAVLRVGRTLGVVIEDVSPYFAERPPDLPGLLGGAALDDARVCVETIAPTKSPVLVLGETGTGKEVIAHLIHARSGRPGPWVALNCAAVPSELVDAELFGHTRGAFSGATASRTGLFRAAHGGTLFLDEIGEMPPMVQAKLLRTLETGEVRPVGDDRPILVDVRVVAATNRDVEQLLESGAFRGDLLHRLAGLRIRLPALRYRAEDVPALAEHFAAGSGVRLGAPALERLILYAWPGNVRELRNFVSAAVEVARRRGHAEIEPEDLPGFGAPSPSRRAQSERETEQLSRRISDALTAHAGDVAAAARELGMSRSVLYETLRRLRIDPRAYRPR